PKLEARERQKGFLKRPSQGGSPTFEENYGYGFNGKEKDDEINGEASVYNLGARMYDARIGKMFSVDPWTKKYPWQTPYAYHNNTPIWQIDWMGLGGEDDELPWYLGPNKYRPTPLLTLGLHNIKLPYVPYQRKDGLKHFIPNVIVSYYHGFATTWNEGMEGRTSSDMAFESADGIEMLLNDVVEGNLDQQHVEQASIFLIVRKIGKVRAFGWEKRLAAYNKFSKDWAKASFSEALNKFAPGVKGTTSKDGVKRNYLNTETNIEIKLDLENNYFRIYDHNKNQYVDMTGKTPSTGKLEYKEARNYVKAQTHLKNTDSFLIENLW
ncbi:RHS repeat-associated core domain-containing protein, partial [Aureibacter tunicatorum]